MASATRVAVEEDEYFDSDVLEHLAAAKVSPGSTRSHQAYLAAAKEIRAAFIAGVTWRDIAMFIGKTQKSTRQLVEWALSAQYEDEDNMSFPLMAGNIPTAHSAQGEEQ
jgi:hypothetical protein